VTGRTVLVLVATLLAIAACQREQRRFSEVAAASHPPGEQFSSEGYAYENNAWAVSEGKQLYQKFNCVGCHAHGGGGMGPALMDNTWLYGSRMEQIFASIAEGRPQGMPAFGDKLPAEQIWKIAAYVRSMSGLLAKDVSPNRDDHMQVRPAEQATPRATPTTVSAPR
jgi:cytochrome c oxidase cbb3-type subunit 3